MIMLHHLSIPGHRRNINVCSFVNRTSKISRIQINMSEFGFTQPIELQYIRVLKITSWWSSRRNFPLQHRISFPVNSVHQSVAKILHTFTRFVALTWRQMIHYTSYARSICFYDQRGVNTKVIRSFSINIFGSKSLAQNLTEWTIYDY